MADSSEPAFLFLYRKEAVAPVDYLSTFATAPCYFYMHRMTAQAKICLSILHRHARCLYQCIPRCFQSHRHHIPKGLLPLLRGHGLLLTVFSRLLSSFPFSVPGHQYFRFTFSICRLTFCPYLLRIPDTIRFSTRRHLSSRSSFARIRI